MSEKQQFWFQHIEQWQQSGLSQAEYARQQKLSIKSFGYYRRRYRQQSAPDKKPTPLLPVTVANIETNSPPAQPGTTGITLTSPSGFRIELAPGFDPQTLRTVLQTLEVAA